MSIEQKQTVLNLYNSGIPVEIIASQTDLDINEVNEIIRHESSQGQLDYKSPSTLAEFYLDTVLDITSFIKDAQSRVWTALQAKPHYNMNADESRQLLEKLLDSKVQLVIINVDLVGSTKLSMSLSANRIADIIRAFTQEMSILITSYGGYIIKYVGDAVLGFFLVRSNSQYDEKLPCINAVNCAFSMIDVVNKGINPILGQYDYPEIRVRIGIDVGENVVVQYGWEKTFFTQENNKVEIRRPIIDVLGYTISITAKMTSLAKPNQVVIGQFVYDVIEKKQKQQFTELPINSDVWNYISNSTGSIYRLYASK
ncbi:MAG: adenylate/guanylate cyclase domain-containing protein [Nitrososphaeraceae archaeon]